MKKAKLWGTVGLVILVIILVLQNTGSVSTHFLFFTFTMPRAALLALTMLVGIATGLLIAMMFAARRGQRTSTSPGQPAATSRSQQPATSDEPDASR